MSYEDLELPPAKELTEIIGKVTENATLNHDHIAENLFSNNIDTRKNLERRSEEERFFWV